MSEGQTLFLWVMAVLFGGGLGATIVVAWLLFTGRIKIK